MAARTVEVDLPAQTTLDQAIVALLKLRRGDVPGDATLDQAAVLRFGYTTSEEATPAVPPRTSRPRGRRRLDARSRPAANNASSRRLPGPRARRDHQVVARPALHPGSANDHAHLAAPLASR